MPKIRMTGSYRHFYKPGDVVQEDPKKAKELVESGRAEYVEVEKAAPINKEVTTDRKVGTECPVCGRIFASERGMKSHKGRSHK